MTWKLILALVVGFCISSAVGAVLVPYLRKIKAGQAIREDGPTWHMSKTGTPTMGGMMFIIAVTPFSFMRARISSKSVLNRASSRCAWESKYILLSFFMLRQPDEKHRDIAR